jgi:hypothetical protein
MMQTLTNLPPTLRGPQNSMQQRFQVLINLLTVIGFGMLAAAGQISVPIGFLFLVFFVPLFHPRFRLRFQLAHWLGNLLTWIYVPLFMLDIFLFSGSFVPDAPLDSFRTAREKLPAFETRPRSCLLADPELSAGSGCITLTIDVSFLILFESTCWSVWLLSCCSEMKRAALRTGPQELKCPQVPFRSEQAI